MPLLSKTDLCRQGRDYGFDKTSAADLSPRKPWPVRHRVSAYASAILGVAGKRPPTKAALSFSIRVELGFSASVSLISWLNRSSRSLIEEASLR